MAPPFYLKCLGEPALLGPDGQPRPLKVRKHLALLVYLAVESGSRHHRDRLAALLWPALPEAEARHSLATGITALRAIFGGDVVDASRDHIRWNYPGLELDLARLGRGDVLGGDAVGPLDVGGFLEDLEIPGASEFMLWRERRRAQWLPQVHDALVARMDRCRRTGDSRTLELLADRLLALDELSEEAARAKIEGRAFAGDRIGALRIFEAWKERLAAELGAAPSPLLERMAVRLRRRQWERSTDIHIPPVRTEQWKDRPFVGRADEYRALYEAWERTQRGEPGHLLVVGESGIGKSTVVERLTTAASLEGAACSRVPCYEIEREIPYGVLGSLVMSLLDRPGATATAPEALAELARTVPAVARRFTHLPPPSTAEGETARFRLAEAVHQLTTAVADEQPLIMVVEDHHLADDASLAVLHLLLRRLQAEPVMLVLVARESEMSRSPQAARLQESLPRLGARRVAIPPLPDEESAELITALFPPSEPQPGPAVRQALIRAAHGYPMVLELLSRDWALHGERSLALGLGTMTPDAGEPEAMNETYRRLVERLLDSLDPTARSVLNLASVLGHRLNDLSLYALADLSTGQTIGAMTALAAARVFRDVGEGLEFVNELVRAQTYLNVPPSIRTLLHGHIAVQLIEREQTKGEAIPGLEIAWHCIRGGRPDAEAAPYLLRGASQAMQRGAPYEAERALRTGFRVIGPEQRDEARTLQAEACQDQGLWEESLEVLLEVTDEADRARRRIRDAMRFIASSHLSRFSQEEIVETAEILRQWIGQADDPRELAIVAHAGATMALGVRSQRVAGALLRALAARDAAQVTGRSRDILELALGKLAYQAHPAEAAMATLEKSLARLLSDGTMNAALADMRVGLGCLKVRRGSIEEGVGILMTAFDTAMRLANEHLAGAAAANCAIGLGQLGRFHEQAVWAQRARKLLGTRSITTAGAIAIFSEGVSCYAQGNVAGTLRAAEELLAAAADSTISWTRVSRPLLAADLFWLAGQRRKALDLAERALAGKDGSEASREFCGRALRWRLNVAIDRGDPASLKDEVDRRVAELDDYDATDQAEILGAFVKVTLAIGQRVRAQARHRRLAACLAGLPEATVGFLRRLGALPD